MGGLSYDQHISIHALREEGDASCMMGLCVITSFLSTPSARRATAVAVIAIRAKTISIHALREEGDLCTCKVAFTSSISIHALREEGDSTISFIGSHQNNFYPRPPRGGRHFPNIPLYSTQFKFLSTPSARRATDDTPWMPTKEYISIHALREEGDAANDQTNTPLGDFYPRPPRGGRPSTEPSWIGLTTFLSTPSARRATRQVEGQRQQAQYFYPRPPRGGRPWLVFLSSILSNFYPRPPRGGRRSKPSTSDDHQHFYPRPPRGGRPGRPHRRTSGKSISIHALREEGDLLSTCF